MIIQSQLEINKQSDIVIDLIKSENVGPQCVHKLIKTGKPI